MRGLCVKGRQGPGRNLVFGCGTSSGSNSRLGYGILNQSQILGVGEGVWRGEPEGLI